MTYLCFQWWGAMHGFKSQFHNVALSWQTQLWVCITICFPIVFIKLRNVDGRSQQLVSVRWAVYLFIWCVQSDKMWLANCHSPPHPCKITQYKAMFRLPKFRLYFVKKSPPFIVINVVMNEAQVKQKSLSNQEFCECVWLLWNLCGEIFLPHPKLPFGWTAIEMTEVGRIKKKKNHWAIVNVTTP